MRTNIVIDDKLMAEVMATGRFKTKREAVEEGLRLLKRRQVYDGLLALRGKLHWDDSDKGWADYRNNQSALKAKGLPHDAYAVLPPQGEPSPPARVALAAEATPKPYRGRKKP